MQWRGELNRAHVFEIQHAQPLPQTCARGKAAANGETRLTDCSCDRQISARLATDSPRKLQLIAAYRRTRLRPSPSGLTPRVALTGAVVYRLSCKWSGVKAAQARWSRCTSHPATSSVCFSSIYRILTMLLHLFPPAVTSIFSAVLMSQ